MTSYLSGDVHLRRKFRDRAMVRSGPQTTYIEEIPSESARKLLGDLAQYLHEGVGMGQLGRFRVPQFFLSPMFCFSVLLSIVILAAASSSERNAREDGTSSDEIRLHSGRIDGVALSPDGRFAASASSDRTLKVWEFATRRQETIAVSGINGFSGIALSPDGQTLAAGTFDGRVFLADLGGGRPCAVTRPMKHTGP